MVTLCWLAQLLLAALSVRAALIVDFGDPESVKQAAKSVAQDLMKSYSKDIPGLLSLPPPSGDYYFWTSGAFWATMIDYRSRTGDTEYDDPIKEGLLFQSGPNDDFLSPNWTATLANDDQGFWASAAMLAAQSGFANPGAGDPAWLDLAKNVFAEQSSLDRRVGNGTQCDGALRWQFWEINAGYDFIDAGSNALYFNLGAKLAVLNDNQTAGELASLTYDKLADIGIISEGFDVYSGSRVEDCGQLDKLQFSYSAALITEGAAIMYNYTGSDEWRTKTQGLVDRTLELFFPDEVAFEVSCEKAATCTTDMRFYKSVLHRSLASTAAVAPYTADKINPVLKKSASAAVAQCTGGDNNRMCGFGWSSGEFDDQVDAASEMGVLSALLSVLPNQAQVKAPAGNGGTGGNTDSAGNTNGSNQNNDSATSPPGSMGSQMDVGLFAVVGGLMLAAVMLA